MARRRSRFLVRQRLFVWGLGAVILGALGYFSWVALRDQPLGGYLEGEHYQVAERPRRVRGAQVEALEFFSYGCVHCYNFDADLEAWVAGQGDGIRFLRLPLAGSDHWRLLARAFFAMQALELEGRWHYGLFREIHERQAAVNTPARVEAFFAEAGVAGEDFRRVFNSAAVVRQVERADRLARRLQVTSVPTVVIDGKFLVSASRAGGLRRMLEVMDFLVEKVEVERAAGNSG